MLKTGIILKIISEYAYVLFEKQVYECKSKGKLRHNNQKPTTGDFVTFEILDTNDFKGIIFEILKRKNELYRPRISNIDQVVIITSVKEPILNTYTLNKYLCFVESLELKPVLAFTKVDLVDINDEYLNLARKYEDIGYEIYLINNMIETDLEWKKFILSLEKKVSVFTGQTGTGKSTTLNHIIPNIFEKTQEISKSLNRGKHTTTKNELFIYKDGLIGDTPGFSSFEFKEMTPAMLATSLTYFKKILNKCKFNNCIHVNNTPGCQLIEDVKNNKFPKFIYEDYIKIQLELENEQLRRKY
ncbi:ribosome small subunit-dependent GTPase A [Spiroplasma taiwanense]|uniref:Small ribosomal subunit biogenesis GTPase RsgA n=1 Tax=Spiroplasma taiwanense CT-1 TaxID=1276220 RepID=S5MCS5_9MOLU|nr:ribosome small subunit-dependent GTPase A [Spiroplasma taiwanense]AGR41523.1 ribosome biogenesis GTPase [Spiroplasma taiwanense CT-1]